MKSLREKIKKLEKKIRGEKIGFVFIGPEDREKINELEQTYRKEGYTRIFFVVSKDNWMGQEFDD